MSKTPDTYLDRQILQEIITNVKKIAGAESACLLTYDEQQQQLSCVYNQHCQACAFNAISGCAVREERLPKDVRLVLHGEISEPKPVHLRKKNGHSAEVLLPIAANNGSSPGVLIFSTRGKSTFSERTIEVATSAAKLCGSALEIAKEYADSADRLAASNRMIEKLKMLSDASNVLLIEFEDKPLSEKLDFIVRQTLNVLDAELATLWLVRGDRIYLESSFSATGKMMPPEPKSSLVGDSEESGVTGFLAHELAKKNRAFNLWGAALKRFRKARARPDTNMPYFVPSRKMYSELAYPILHDGKELIGLLFAYNKKGIDGNPLQDGGFSTTFDEPLMSILTTKLAISIKNADLLKNLKKFQLIVESTPNPVVVVSRTGIITYANPGALNLFGDVIERHIGDCYASDDKSTGLQKAKEIKRELLRNRGHLKDHETVFLGKSGEAIPLSISTSLLHDEYGREADTIGIAKDMRGIKALTETGQSLLRTHEFGEILDQISQVASGTQKCIRAYIKLLDKKTGKLRYFALKSKQSREVFPVTSTTADLGMTGYVYQTQIPALAKDLRNENEKEAYNYAGIFPNVLSKIVVPITYPAKNLRLGVISVDSDEADAFSSNDMYYLENVAHYAAIALENANVIGAKDKMINRLQAFDRVQKITTAKDFEIDQVYDALLDAVVDDLGLDYATICAVDKEKKIIGPRKVRNVDSSFLQSATHSLESKDIQAWVVRNKKHIELNGWDERLDREIYEKFNHANYVRVIIPIIARGEAIGTLETGYERARKSQIEQDEISTLQKLVNMAAMGIEQTNLLERLREDYRITNELEKQLDALNQASIQILDSNSEEDAIFYIFRSLESIGYTKGMLALINEENEMIEGRYPLGDNWTEVCRSAKYSQKENNILALSLRARRAMLCKNCYNDPRWNRKLAQQAGIEAQYVIPLLVKNKPIGTLQIDLSDRLDLVHGDPVEFERRMKVLDTFASQSAIAIRNIRDVVTIDRLESNIAETAHEFRSPLHNIMTQLGGLKESLRFKHSDADVDHYVSIIEEEIFRAKRQVQNTLLHSDKTRRTLEFDFRSGQIQRIIQDCVNGYKLRAMERNIRIIVRDNIQHLPPFKFDHDKIEQAITNIIDNALKYSHFNQYIDINGFDDGSNIVLSFTDRGLGIPPKEYESIFLGFKRSETKDQIRYIPGTGLGLKICKEIIEKHGGQITVTSVAAGKNPKKIHEYQDYKTTFHIKLPKHNKER